MKFLVAFVCLAVASYAAAQDDVPIIRNVQDVQPDRYSYSYELGNGISAQESGSLTNPETISAQGSYKFTAPDGQTFETQYIANENGFQPTGSHLPETPPQIQRFIEFADMGPESK